MQRRSEVTLALVALSVWAVTSGSAADVQPGDVISAANVATVKDLVSPGMAWCVEHGFPMTIVATKPIALRRAFIEATEKYAAQVTIGSDGLRLEGYVAGRPFPNIDPNDAQAPVKIMHNYSLGSTVDDVDVRNFDADTGPISGERSLQIERHFLIGHFRRLAYVGRLYVDPKPTIPNQEGFHYKETMHPLIEPFDLKGIGFTSYRYLNPARLDDTWLYLPSLHRVKRLSSAERSDALFGQDTDQDSYGGYAGQIGWMDWRLLGQKIVLAAFHTSHLPVKWADGVTDWAFDGEWEKREVWVVEGRSKLPQYAYSKRVLYLDKEVYAIPYSDMYDRGGELWKVWINNFKIAREAFPGSAMQYAEDTGFVPAIVMVDMQLGHATRAALPSHRFPGEPGWYFHQGEREGTTDEQFTIAALIASDR